MKRNSKDAASASRHRDQPTDLFDKRSRQPSSLFIAAGYRPSAVRHRRRRLLILLAGLILAAGGMWTLAGYLSSNAARQRDEATMQTLFYESSLPEAQVDSPSFQPSLLLSLLLSPIPSSTTQPHAAVKPARTFAAAPPFAVYTKRERFLSLSKINRDVAGWLSIEGMLDLPVVQRDNSYYLTHDFRGTASNSGALFLDEHYDYYPPNENLLIHGHNMRDGSMFGRLHKYRDRAFYTSHCLIRFETLYESGDYAVFAALTTSGLVSDPTYIPFSYTHFDTDTMFEAYIAIVRERSVIRCSLDISPADELLTLSTCADGSNRYFVVFARRIRDSEDLAAVKTEIILSAYQ